VVGAGAAGAVADDVGALGLAVGADAALGAQRLLGGGGEDGAGHRRAPAVERVAAGRGDVGLLDAVVAVDGLAAGGADRGDGDDAVGFGGDVEAAVVDLADPRVAARVAGAGAVGLRLAEVGRPVAERGDERDAPVPGVVERALHSGDDGALFEPLLLAVGRVVAAVEQPGVDVVAHVDHVDADVPGVGEGVEAGLEEEEAGVLTGPDVDELDVGGDAGDADPVDRGGDGAGHVGAVAVVVPVDGVLAGGDLAGSVEVLALVVLGAVGDEVTAELAVEVGRDVGVVAVDPGVDDADGAVAFAGLLLVGHVRADHPHVPLAAGERVALPRLEGGGVGEGPRGGPGDAAAGGAADGPVGGDADDGGVLADGLGEAGAGALDDQVAELGLGTGDGAARLLHGGDGGGAAVAGVEDQILGGRGGHGTGGGTGGQCGGRGQRREDPGNSPHF